jgi:hypothetical protein
MRRRADLMMEGDEETVALDGSKKMRSSIHSIPIAVAFGTIAVLLGLYGLVYTIDSILPTPLYLADEVGKFRMFAKESTF